MSVDKKKILAFDIGTTGVKTCIVEAGETLRILAGASAGYGLYLLPDGGAEQDPDEWWSAMCSTARQVMEETGTGAEEIAGISFCSQMQGLVLVDREGKPVRRPMSYMDQRAKAEIREGMQKGICIAGGNARRLLKCIRLTGAAPLSVKDPVWKYKWVEKHEPENFRRVYRWLDVKESLSARAAGVFVMTPDSAFSTMLYDTRKGREGWSRELCRLFGVNMDHLPEVIPCQAQAGTLREDAARELGLLPGTPVFGGGGDATLIGVGAGAAGLGDTHIYQGTSGWVETVTDRRAVDPSSMIAAIVGAEPGRFNYFAEMETAGKCLEWVKNHLALDEIGIYLEKHDVTEGTGDHEAVCASLFTYLTDTIRKAEPGSGGVIFTPWLHGNRCPFEDPAACGMFFNVRLETGKTEMIRAVVEGICFHLRWMLECADRKVRSSEKVRFVGGGALSPVTCQILADILNRTVETVPDPQDVGSVGAAALACQGLGIIRKLEEVKDMIPVTGVYEPSGDPAVRAVYDRNYRVFRELYEKNRTLMGILNR